MSHLPELPGLAIGAGMSFNLATILTEATLAAPDAPACRFAGTTTTYRELDELSGRFAAGLRAAGLGPGQVVAMQLPNIPHFLIGYFGALKAGLVVLPLNPLLVAPELEYHLTDSAASLLIGFEGMHAEAAKACETTDVPLPDGTRSALALISSAPLEEPGGDVAARDPDDTAVLVYTSGTTGRPKGAELTHFQLYMNSTVAGGLFGVRSDDVVLAVLPFFHVFGLSSVINVSVRYGACLSILPRFQPAAVLGAIEADRCTVLPGVPTMLHALAQMDIAGRDLSALRVAVSGGASLPEDIMRTFEDKYGIEVLEGYGMTETASSWPDPGHPRHRHDAAQHKAARPVRAGGHRYAGDPGRKLHGRADLPHADGRGARDRPRAGAHRPGLAAAPADPR